MRRLQKVILLAMIAILPLMLLSETNKGQILEIKIEGNNRIEETLIRSLLAFEIGDFLAADATSKTLKNLYQLEVFDDLSISTTPLQQGIVVTVHIKEYPVIRRIKFKGNKKIKEKKLKEIIILDTGNYYAPYNKKEIENKILNAYKEKQFHYAQIEITEKLVENYVDLTIKITEGSKIKVRKITIHGNHDFKDKSILRKMKTKKAGFLRSGKFEEEEFQEDLDKILKFYTKKGYLDAHIISYDKEIKEDGFYIDIYLYEGVSYIYNGVEFQGNKVFKEKELAANIKLEKGEIFNQEKFDEQIAGVGSMYYEEGYIYAAIIPQILKTDNKINVQVSIEENTRAKIHKIHIRGNNQTKEKVIRRQLVLAPGDYFQQSRVRTSLSNIINTGFFEPEIIPDFNQINEKGDIDLIVELDDKVSGTANGGVALNSSDGLTGQLGVTHNNLLGNSWKVALAWEFGGSTQNVDLSFTNPYFLDSNILTGFSMYFADKEYDTYKLRKNGGAIKVGVPISLINRANATLGYSYYRKRYSVLDDVADEEVSDELANLVEEGWQDNSSVSVTLSRDTRNNIYFATSGTQLILYNEIAGGLLQGDNSYFKQIFQANWYVKTFLNFALRTKWRFGYVTGYDNQSVPPDERFYPGGTGSDGIRGYSDRSIGPTDEYGNNDGGEREIIFSTEYVIPVVSNQVALLTFLDAGDCFNSFDRFNLWELKKGTGVGLRIFSPFGLIGFDYAYNLSDFTWEPHFQFGTTF